MKQAESPPSLPSLPARVAMLGATSLMFCLVLVQISCQQAPLLPRTDWDEKRFGPLVPHQSFPGDCSICHIPERWDLLREDFEFDHEAQTGVALEGAHRGAACLRCHNDRGPVREYQERGCGGCHVDPHDATLGMDCRRCHQQGSWRPQGIVSEHGRTRFPLVGTHLAVACDACHLQAMAGIFTGLPIDCHLCHQADLVRAQSPDHVAAGWTQTCERCHTPRSMWSGAGFSHSLFPLTGAHLTDDCTKCHQNGVFRGTPRDCLACHSDEFFGATNPNHAGGGFPTDCNLCHSTFGWQPAEFEHAAFFPLVGDHGGMNCVDCHTTGNFSSFSCIDCHQHRRSEMDDEHSDVGGYVYNSRACLSCHPTGRE